MSSTAIMARFQVGDRVMRPVNVYARSSPVRTGTVTRRYAEKSSLGHWDRELYEVCWDREAGKPIEPLTCVGYLPHGIEPVLPPLGNGSYEDGDSG